MTGGIVADSRSAYGNQSKVTPVIKRKRVIETIDEVCPYCNKVIGEKETYEDPDGYEYHSPCMDKGALAKNSPVPNHPALRKKDLTERTEHMDFFELFEQALNEAENIDQLTEAPTTQEDPGNEPVADLSRTARDSIEIMLGKVNKMMSMPAISVDVKKNLHIYRTFLQNTFIPALSRLEKAANVQVESKTSIENTLTEDNNGFQLMD
jgi:hypothetical protein